MLGVNKPVSVYKGLPWKAMVLDKINGSVEL